MIILPTFKNETSRYIDYEAMIKPDSGKTQKILIRFEPNEERELPFWIPYQQLGLTLISADFPPIPNTILVNGTFKFNEGTERKFMIEPCDIYTVNVIVQSGKVMMYTGNASIGVEITPDIEIPYHYKGLYDWEYVPYLRFVGVEDETEVTIHAEVGRGKNIRMEI